MLTIRMARAGTKKRPFYHIVVADSRAPRLPMPFPMRFRWSLKLATLPKSHPTMLSARRSYPTSWTVTPK